MCAVLAPIAVIDARRQIIPDVLNLLLAACGLALTYASQARSPILLLAEAIAVMGLFGMLSILYRRFRGRSGLGWGDVKFMGAATCWVGLPGIPLVTLMASASGLAYVLIRQLTARGISPQTRIAFGPHLSLGLLVVWLANAYGGGA